MVSVALSTLHMADVVDGSEMSFPLMAALKWRTAQVGHRRGYANGRQRIVLRKQITHDAEVTLPLLTITQAAWLHGRVGRLLLVRDDRGHKAYGSFLELPEDLHDWDSESDVSLSFLVVTYTESV